MQFHSVTKTNQASFRCRTTSVQMVWRKGYLLLGALLVWGMSAVETRGDQPDTPIDDSPSVLIIADLIYTMDGPPIERGMIWVEGGKIKAVGTSISVPDTTKRIEVPVVMPGMIDAYSSIGVAGGQTEQTDEVTPELEVIDTLDWSATDFAQAAAAGITTAHVVPGSDNVFSGGTCVVKTAGGDRGSRIVMSHRGSTMAVCSDPVTGNSSRSRPDTIYVRQPTNRMGVVWIIRSQFAKAQQAGVDLTNQPKLAALKRILDGDPLFALSRTNYDIETLIRLQEECQFKFNLVGGDEVYRVINTVAQAKCPVVYMGVTTGAVRGAEGTELHWNSPGKFEAKGIPFCLAGNHLLEQAQFAHRFGCGDEAALSAITAAPADILGLTERVGRIRVGLDADLVGLTGNPLEISTGLVWTMCNGEWVAKSEAGESTAKK